MMMGFIKEGVGNFFKSMINNSGEAMLYRARMELRRFQRRLIMGIFAAVIILAAIVFLAISGAFGLIEYGGLSKTLSFLIIGIVMLLIGILISLVRR